MRIHNSISYIVIAVLSLSLASPLTPQTNLPGQAIEKKITLFFKTMNNYKNLYKKYQKCRSNECTKQQKDELKKELIAAGKQIFIIGGIIITLFGTAATTIFLVRRYKKRKVKPEEEEKTVFHPISIEEEKKQQEKEKIKKQQKIDEKKRIKEEEQLKATKEEEQKREKRLRLQKEEIERQQEKKLYEQQEQEKREQENRAGLARQKKEMEQKDQLDETLDRVHKKLDLFKEVLTKNNILEPPQLQKFKNQVEKVTGLDQAKQLLKQVLNDLTGPGTAFLDELTQLENSTAQSDLPTDQLTPITIAIRQAIETYEKGNLNKALRDIRNAQSSFEKLKLQKQSEPSLWNLGGYWQ